MGDINFLRRQLKVDRQVRPRTGVGPLKNKSAYRTVPVGRVVVDAVAAHLQQYPGGPDDFVLRRPDGSPLSRDYFNPNVWHGIRKRAGLPTPRCTTCATSTPRRSCAGLNVKVVSTRRGHTDAAMTLNTYTHLWPDEEDRTRQAIDDLFLARDVPQMRHSKEE